MNEIDLFEEFFPGENFTARCERKFRRIISIDPNAYRTRENLKSSTVIKAETLRHLLFYPYKIHCFSRFRYIWEILMMTTYGLAFFIIPIHVAFIYERRRVDEATFWEVIVSVINVIYLMDITINFLSCYQDCQTKKIVFEGRKIATNYIRNYFWIDVLSCLPDRIIIMMIYGRENLVGNDFYQCFHNELTSSSACVWDFIMILSLLKFLQLPLFRKYLGNYLQQHNKSANTMKIIKNFFTLIFCHHFTVCLIFLIIRALTVERESIGVDDSNTSITDVSFWTETNDVEKYIICFFYTTYTLSLFASTIEEKSQVDMTVGIIFTLIGYVFNIWLVSQAHMYLTTSYGPSIRFHELRAQLKEYVAFKHIPKSVQKRILTYYDYCFRMKFYRKGEINGLFTGELKHLIIMETCQQHLKRNYLFRILPDNLLHAIADCMTEAIYLKNDVICRNDRRRGQRLYLIVHGTVAVYSQEGNEIAHLYDGNMFGECEFLQHYEMDSYMNYVAVEECNILVLHKSDFMRNMADNAELINQMRMIVEEPQRNNEEENIA